MLGTQMVGSHPGSEDTIGHETLELPGICLIY